MVFFSCRNSVNYVNEEAVTIIRIKESYKNFKTAKQQSLGSSHRIIAY
jgi:hypothetical protein